MGAISFAANPVMHARTKHIKIDLHFVRGNVLQKELELRYVPFFSRLLKFYKGIIFCLF